MIEHIAIIMDGNGRWAQERGLPRSAGHEAGSKQISQVARAAAALGVKCLTLYTFSTENWKRPADEVKFLMDLIPKFCKEKLKELKESGIRLRVSGRSDKIPLLARKALEKAIAQTASNDKITVNLALNYGGRAEIVDAVNACLKNEPGKKEISEEDLAKYLYSPDLPDPELLIRTGGEFRLSNFLLWQLSYSELYVTDCYWPDFGEEQLKIAVEEFSRRKRRFGGL